MQRDSKCQLLYSCAWCSAPRPPHALPLIQISSALLLHATLLLQTLSCKARGPIASFMLVFIVSRFGAAPSFDLAQGPRSLQVVVAHACSHCSCSPSLLYRSSTRLMQPKVSVRIRHHLFHIIPTPPDPPAPPPPPRRRFERTVSTLHVRCSANSSSSFTPPSYS